MSALEAAAGTKRVLVVDDEPVTRRVLEAMLRREGFAVVAVEDGAEAIAVLDRERFDLVITDRHMPTIDGTALLQHLRSSPRLSAVPVIMMTGSGTGAAEAAAFAGGALAFLTKPISARDLSAALDRALPGRGA